MDGTIYVKTSVILLKVSVPNTGRRNLLKLGIKRSARKSKNAVITRVAASEIRIKDGDLLITFSSDP